MGRVLRGVTVGFEGRGVDVMPFIADLRGLAVLGRSDAGFFSIFVVEASTERRPREALVGDVDLAVREAGVRFVGPFMAAFMLS